MPTGDWNPRPWNNCLVPYCIYRKWHSIMILHSCVQSCHLRIRIVSNSILRMTTNLIENKGLIPNWGGTLCPRAYRKESSHFGDSFCWAWTALMQETWDVASEQTNCDIGIVNWSDQHQPISPGRHKIPKTTCRWWSDWDKPQNRISHFCQPSQTLKRYIEQAFLALPIGLTVYSFGGWLLLFVTLLYFIDGLACLEFCKCIIWLMS